ncbi:TetR/AcrR family transcriptional regulator [Anaerosalibacter bizertensis]|uniref:TetR/AcrR family transcriptional regulator n=1 Tax=Anaerosalibacter bizertensis TaxID=932217 RepID=A0A844FF60_9FIRM|nr:TetR/AcrR family transcriptional regulator [Anaerosalibacter bizertensis]MSS42634.1 TetR/AcrR family transcriptional regulator [Anaerosalibacter bizertensis]HHV26170.1 TetR/AcrR family transcriptional regulator [Tissierellia bacterium]
MSKVEKNKKQKESSLYKAAYDLFTTKGINDTAISDIIKKAGVGKGTFYLYFKNKYDILDKIILNKSTHVLSEAIRHTKAREFKDFEEELLYFIDYIIEYLRKDKLMLKLIYKNLSWGVFKKAYNDYEEIHEIYLMFERGYEKSPLHNDDIEKILFIILELTGSVCYSSIILNEPADIDEMKPILFETVKKIIN